MPYGGYYRSGLRQLIHRGIGRHYMRFAFPRRWVHNLVYLRWQLRELMSGQRVVEN